MQNVQSVLLFPVFIRFCKTAKRYVADSMNNVG